MLQWLSGHPEPVLFRLHERIREALRRIERLFHRPRVRVTNTQLMSKSVEQTSGLNVWRIRFSLRYAFNQTRTALQTKGRADCRALL